MHACVLGSGVLNLECYDWMLQVWSTKMQNHVAHIPMKANVCCVNFSPTSAHDVAIGSADHNVHLYDLRSATRPVHVFSGTLVLAHAIPASVPGSSAAWQTTAPHLQTRPCLHGNLTAA